MANYGVIIDLVTNEIQLKEIPETGSNHLIWTQAATPVINPQSFDVYETLAAGQTVGTVECTDNDVTFEITAGNTGSKFTINSSTGEITTAGILDYETLSAYTLTIKVTSNQFPTLTDTADMSITVLKLYTICTDNVPSFSGTSYNNLVGYLTVGPVQINTGTLGDYIIEWHLNSTSGTTVFITGNSGNTDPSIESYHPINYEPVQAGTLYAVIRYIEINDVKYSAYSHSAYGLYSPDLVSCLGTKTVVAMSCSNGSTGSTWYHTVTYTNSTMPSSVASRTMTYDLNEDGSSQEVSWRFYGYAIADRLKITYVSGQDETLIEDWVIGSDCSGYTYTSLPYLFDQEYLTSSFSLTGFTYTTGDYLLFEVSPSYNNPSNTDTNWQLNISCFTESEPLDLVLLPSNDYSLIDTGSTTTMTWNSTNCRYELNVHTLSGITSSQLASSDAYRYIQAGVGYSTDWDTDSAALLDKYTNGSYAWSNSINYGGNIALQGQMEISRTGSTHVTTYTFTNHDDYMHYKNGYASATGSTAWSYWLSDGQHFEHYQTFFGNEKISMTSGDTYTMLNTYFDHSAAFSFDDTNHIITINTVSQTNEYTGTSCNNVHTTITSYNNNINTWYSGTTTTWTTIWGQQYPFVFIYCASASEYFLTTRDWAPQLQVPSGTTQNIVLGPRWFSDGFGNYVIYKYYVRVIITNTGDPLNNWELYTRLNTDGSVAGSWTLIKKVGT